MNVWQMLVHTGLALQSSWDVYANRQREYSRLNLPLGTITQK